MIVNLTTVKNCKILFENPTKVKMPNDPETYHFINEIEIYSGENEKSIALLRQRVDDEVSTKAKIVMNESTILIM